MIKEAPAAVSENDLRPIQKETGKFQALIAALCTILIGCAFLLSRCANYPESLVIRDTLGISDTLSKILKNKYGLFVSINSKVSSTDEFMNRTLLLLGETEAHMDISIITLGMEKTHNFLFNNVISMYTSSEENCPKKDVPCVTRNDTLTSGDRKDLPRVREIYSENADLNALFERRLNSADCVFLMIKSNSQLYSNRLKELIIK